MRICPSARRLLHAAAPMLAIAFAWMAPSAPTFAVDSVPFFCDGSSAANGTCTLFQLDGAQAATANGNTCVGTENGCASEENPVWPADWDALLFPGLSRAPGVSAISGTAPGAWTFSLPWGSFGSFSGIIKSTLVSTGTSTILKQGSKATDDISAWTVASQSSPPKDAFVAGALATYVAPPVAPYGGHELLYFASTRSSPNGSATVGIWFFQQNVQVCSTGPNAGKAMCVDGTSTLAQHIVGDLFLFLTYGGNGRAIIQAATWQGHNGPTGFLGNIPGTITLCAPGATDDACAVTNQSASITLGSNSGPQLPGTGFNVSGPGFAGFPGGVVPALQFEEGGIDLNAIFAGNAPCFSSVMFSSVSSGSSPFNAALKSILLGSFNTCAIAATKQCADGSVSGSNITYPISGTVENTGGGAVTNLSLSDSFAGSSTTISSLTCSCANAGCSITNDACSTVTLQPGGIANYTGSITTTTNGGDNTVTANMNGVGGGTASGTSNTGHCNAISLSDSIGVDKACTSGLVSTSCGTAGSVLAVQNTASGTVTNTGQLTLSSITVYDCQGGSFSADPNPPLGAQPGLLDPTSCTGTLKTVKTIASLGTDPATKSSTYLETYNPTALPVAQTTNTCVSDIYSDTVLVVASCTSSFCQYTKVYNTYSASCPLCPLTLQ